MLKDHNAMTSLRLEPAASRSRVKHSTTALPLAKVVTGGLRYKMLLLLFLYLHVSQDLFIAKDQPKISVGFLPCTE